MVAGEVTDFYCLALLITHLSEFPVSTLLYRYPRMACFLDWVLYTRVLTVFPQLPGKVCLRTCSKPLKTNTPLNSHLFQWRLASVSAVFSHQELEFSLPSSTKTLTFHSCHHQSLNVFSRGHAHSMRSRRWQGKKNRNRKLTLKEKCEVIRWTKLLNKQKKNLETQNYQTSPENSLPESIYFPEIKSP